ncbi:MAG: thioredoxin domain-containing protein [Gemmatimonadetes bacterium]|nr:thioredoxin domain-containing protein [Gemmatimonadota bacterium]
MANRLARASSPYLLQHADNPVDWYPWGPEALAAARTADKPILLSIGYAACHWCHVMARESFEDATTAALMNELFVSVKVDREERPDLDAVYMQAVQAMTGHGGWPMTVFLTPAGEPFYGGTYFPPEDRHGLPSFRRILRTIADAWRTRREEVGRAVLSVAEVYAAAADTVQPGPALDASVLDGGWRGIARRFEPIAGGFGGAPKFPHAMALDVALRRWARRREAQALHIATHSFLQMARGGIFDQVGGGFHRYTVDAAWLVPHFEKMLYDNALLARLGVHLWQATGDDEVRRATERTLAWVRREMTDANGGWYSSLDADSEHEEGKFYVWSADEFAAVAGADASWAGPWFGVTAAGNWEGHNILTARGAAGGANAAGAAFGDGSESAFTPSPAALERVLQRLYAARARRVWPGRDEKIIASWNGLMLRAMAEAARVFDDAEARAAALANGEFLWHAMVREGRVFRIHAKGAPHIPGFLEDHAAVALGFIALYQLTFDRAWLDRAVALADRCVTHFWDEAEGAFYDTADDHERLVVRPRDVMDNATPAGGSLAAELLLMVAEYTGADAPRATAVRALSSLARPMQEYGVMFGHALGAAEMAVHGAIEVAIAGEVGSAPFTALSRAVASQYVPSLVLAGGEGDGAHDIALLAGRTAASGAATAYVCHDYRCAAPTQDAMAVVTQLGAAARIA